MVGAFMTGAASPSWRTSGSTVRICTRLASGGALAVTVLLALHGPALSTTQVIALDALIVLYVIAFRIEFTHHGSPTLPTQPVLVAMLLFLPVSYVPAIVFIAQLIGTRCHRSDSRFIRDAAKCLQGTWPCIGPVAVLLVCGEPAPALSRWPLYLLALGAQFLIKTILTLVKCYLRGRRVKAILLSMVWSLGVDSALAITGLSAVIAAKQSPGMLLFIAAPIALMALLVRDRRLLLGDRNNLGLEVVTAREEAREDQMTGLGNRRAWFEAIDAAQIKIDAAESNAHAAVLLADLNFLKRTNDKFGHKVGDELIVAMAAAIKVVVSPGASACRIGGDEFAILVVGPADSLDLDGLTERLERAIASAQVRSTTVLSASIGTAVCGRNGSLKDTIHAADQAGLRNKQSFRKQSCNLDPHQLPPEIAGQQHNQPM